MVVSSEFTEEQGLVTPDSPRTLRNAASRAINIGYPENMKPLKREEDQQVVIDNYLRWSLHYLPNHICQCSLEGNNRLTVCTLSDGEKSNHWPAGTYSYYLMDGFGRALPYMVLLLQRRIKYQPVEVFYAEKCEHEE